MTQATILTGKQIPTFRLMTMKQAVKLERAGMKMSRGVSATAIARKELGLKPRTPHDLVIKAIEAEIAKQLAEQQAEQKDHALAASFVKVVTGQV